MIILRVIGVLIILLGLVFCITIVGAAIGVPMILVGAVVYFVGYLGKKKAPMVVQVKREDD